MRFKDFRVTKEIDKEFYSLFLMLGTMDIYHDPHYKMDDKSPETLVYAFLYIEELLELRAQIEILFQTVIPDRGEHASKWFD